MGDGTIQNDVDVAESYISGIDTAQSIGLAQSNFSASISFSNISACGHAQSAQQRAQAIIGEYQGLVTTDLANFRSIAQLLAQTDAALANK